jgi:hypothetical protein
MARIKNFLFDDLRETNKSSSVTCMMDRHFTVDPNAQMLIAAFEFKPKSPTNSMTLRQVNTQLESLYISIRLDYLITLQDFFISGLPTGGGEARSRAALMATEQSDRIKNRSKIKSTVNFSSKITITNPKTSSTTISINYRYRS